MSKLLPDRPSPKELGLKLLGTFIDQGPYNVFMRLDASKALAKGLSPLVRIEGDEPIIDNNKNRPFVDVYVESPDAKVVPITLREAARYKLGRLIY